MFNPRIDLWNDHFEWEEYTLVGLTPAGRATVEAPVLNHPRRVIIRRAEEVFGLFPP